MSAPKVTNPLPALWLVYGDLEEDATHESCGEVSWCTHQVYDADVKYVRADIADAMYEALQWIAYTARQAYSDDVAVIEMQRTARVVLAALAKVEEQP